MAGADKEAAGAPEKRYSVAEDGEEEEEDDECEKVAMPKSRARLLVEKFVTDRPALWKKSMFVFALYNLAFVPFRYVHVLLCAPSRSAGTPSHLATHRVCLRVYATAAEIVVDLLIDFIMASEFWANMLQPDSGKTLTPSLWSTLLTHARTHAAAEEEEVHPRNILVNIRSKTSILEVCALVPLDVVGLAIGFDDNLMHPCFRMNKMIRLMQLGWYFDQIRELLNISHNAERVFRIVILILWMIYWLGCVWNLIVWLDGETPRSWHWTQSPGLSDESSGYRLLVGVYYTLTMMTGYGSVLPQSDLQIGLSLVTVLIGVAGNVGVLGTLGSLVQNLDSSGAAFRQKMDAVSDYMRYRKLSPEMRSRINEYYSYLWQSRRGLDEASLIQELPVYLQEEVSLFLNKEIISKVPLFHECDEQFKTAVVVKLIPLVLLPDSHIVRKGEVGREMYFISRGEVQVVSEAPQKEDRIVYATLRDGSFFGEVALLFNDSRRTATVVTSSYCDLFVLRKEDFDTIQESFPDQSKVRNTRTLRTARYPHTPFYSHKHRRSRRLHTNATSCSLKTRRTKRRNRRMISPTAGRAATNEPNDPSPRQWPFGSSVGAQDRPECLSVCPSVCALHRTPKAPPPLSRLPKEREQTKTKKHANKSWVDTPLRLAWFLFAFLAVPMRVGALNENERKLGCAES